MTFMIKSETKSCTMKETTNIIMLPIKEANRFRIMLLLRSIYLYASFDSTANIKNSDTTVVSAAAFSANNGINIKFNATLVNAPMIDR